EPFRSHISVYIGVLTSFKRRSGIKYVLGIKVRAERTSHSIQPFSLSTYTDYICCTHLSQLLLMFSDHLESLWKLLHFPQFSYTAPCRLRISSQCLCVFQALDFCLITIL
ncbi:hypothetical protein HHX47_DHR1002078, partial [Lentinula edodes]